MMSSRNKALAFSSLLIAACFLYFFYYFPQIGTLDGLSESQVDNSETSISNVPEDLDSYYQYLKNVDIEGSQLKLAAYLEGTEIDGNVSLDDSGNLIVDEGLRDFLDYHFSTIGVATIDEIEAHLRSLIDQYLPSPSNGQAHTFLDQYLAYGERLSADNVFKAVDIQNLLDQNLEYESAALSLQHLFDVRREVFGVEIADKLWGEEEANTLYVLEKIKLGGDVDNENVQLSTPMPDSYRKANEESVLYAKNVAAEKELIANGANDQELYDFRLQYYGYEVAERLK